MGSMINLPSHRGSRVTGLESARSSHCSVQGPWVLLGKHQGWQFLSVKAAVLSEGRDRAGDCRSLVQIPAVPAQTAGAGNGVGRGEAWLAFLLLLSLLFWSEGRCS